MAKSSSRTSGGDSGHRNKILLIVSVVILAAAGGWFYMSRPKDLDAQVREQVAAHRAESPQPPKTEDSTGVEVPKEGEATADGAKSDEGGQEAETPTDETASAPKKKAKAKTKAVF